ncbi:precorrin-3B C(17)-methyltransferase [Paenibacillus sp. S150]|nr:precorrin-3B C(17)-methyltransferase [Paenibacillus sp. S150]MBW4085457.1 precorrin-3B C(17)-methyltransferase [Paenibacillus sp. S150]
MNKQGKLLIIGFGPGSLEHITGRALAALEESEAVIGYTTYVDLVKPLLEDQEIVGTGMTEEVSRAQEAVRRAEAGQTIAVISSGDAGVYGMAGLVYEVLVERGWSRAEGVEVEVIPGISAIQSCSSLLGAPVMHDSCTISLSDHLTPWESIAARVEAAGAADFVIAFYNPRSGKRTRQIEEARQILLRYREPATPVGIVKSAYRNRELTVVTTLQDMLDHEIGMLSTVIVGNSATMVYEGLMITPRGYGRKYSLGSDTQTLKPHERLRTSAEPWSLAALDAGEDSKAGEPPADKGRIGLADCEDGGVPKGAVLNAGPSSGVNGMAEPAVSAGAPVHRTAVCELELSPASGSRKFSGAQMKLLAELAGDDGRLGYTRDGHLLLRSFRTEHAEMAPLLAAAGLNATVPGDVVKVKTCGFCDLRKENALGAARRLYKELNGRPVPRELQINVAGCGMACSSAVLEDIGLIYSRGSYELYLGGKKSGRAAHAGSRVREGMNEGEAVAAVMEVVEQYCAEGYQNERFYAFFERMGSGLSMNCKNTENGLDCEHTYARTPEGAHGLTTVLLVGHGSRVEAGNEELRDFTRLLAARMPELTIETCFIELSAPSISEGIDKCVQEGAGTVYVVPIILFAAGHSKLDIPMALDQAKLKYPGVEFVYGRPIGVQERAVEILLDRIAEAVPLSGGTAEQTLPAEPGSSARLNTGKLEAAAAWSEEETALAAEEETSSSEVGDGDTIVLVMGRGGSDPDANSDFCKLTRMLWERTSYKSVEACFIAVTKPSLPEGLERCLALGARKIIVLPYLLFTGVLMKQFSEAVSRFAAAHPEIEVEAGSYLGSHPLLSDMLLERIEETVAGRSAANCDNCKYRDEASAHHYHHHHGSDGHDHGHEGEDGHEDHGHGNHGHHAEHHVHEHTHGHQGAHHGHSHEAGHPGGHGHHSNSEDAHSRGEQAGGAAASASVAGADIQPQPEASQDAMRPASAPKAH